jgi:hypothetical protein
VEEILRRLDERAPVCFLCKWIAEDLRKNGRPTGWPNDFNGQGQFPTDGKLEHLKVEGILDLLKKEKV